MNAQISLAFEMGEAAHHHESAQAEAHGCSASGVSAETSLGDLIINGGDKTIPMPSSEQLKSFLVEYYLHSRFQGRDGPVWGANYSDGVTAIRLQQLHKRGITCVSIYESNRGRVIWFDRSLTILNPDEAPAQIQRIAGNLTHILGGGSL